MREPIPHRHPYPEPGLEAPDKPATLTPPYRLQFCASNPPQVEIVKFAERIKQVPQARCSPGAPAIPGPKPRRHFHSSRQLPFKNGPQAYPNDGSLLKLGDYLLAEQASSQEPGYVRNQNIAARLPGTLKDSMVSEVRSRTQKETKPSPANGRWLRFDKPRAPSAFVQQINLCRHDEVAFRQPVNFVRPQSDFHFSPG